SVAISLVGMAVEGLMAHATPPEQRGRAAGMFQAGNVGGAGIGGGLGLYIATHVSTEAALIVIATSLFACTFFLYLVPEAPRLQAATIVTEGGKAPSGVALLLGRIVEVFREVGRCCARAAASSPSCSCSCRSGRRRRRACSPARWRRTGARATTSS